MLRAGNGGAILGSLDTITVEKPVTSAGFPERAREAAAWCAFGSGVAVIFSIAVSQILLGGAILALILGHVRLRFPRITLPLALFLLGTLVAFAFSEVPSAGLSQIKHMYLYLTLPVVFTAIGTTRRASFYFMAVVAASALMALLGCIQYAQKLHAAHAAGKDFYEFYLEARITGLQKHWMAFSGQELYGLLIGVAGLFFAPVPARRPRLHLAIRVFCILIIGVALVLSETRGVWVAAFIGMTYLLWCWRRIYTLAAPVVVIVSLLVAPKNIRDRVDSLFHPHGDTDSNSHRIVCWRTGWEMIKAHPLLGLGPDVQKLKFYDYVPKDIPWPLPTGFYGHLHNLYIQYAADRGIPTMLMIVWFLLAIIINAWRKLARLAPGPSIHRFLLQAGIACTIGSMIEGIVEYNLNTSVVLALFLAIAACTSLAAENEQQPSRT